MQKKLQLSGTIYRFFRLPCVKGFASMRSMLAVLAERGSETAQRLEGLFSTTHPPLPRSPLSHKRGLIKINPRLCRTSSLLSSLISYLREAALLISSAFSQHTRKTYRPFEKTTAPDFFFARLCITESISGLWETSQSSIISISPP